MCQAFSINLQDIHNVLIRNGKKATVEQLEYLFNYIDMFCVENAAKQEIGTENQINAAYQEIEFQIKEYIIETII